MNTDPDVAAVAALIAVPARATILIALMDGRALPAGELARRAALSPQAASAHLNKLVAGGFLLMVSTGRHRYYRLASTEVAQVIEAMMPLARVTARQTPHPAEPKPIQVARSCYDHLAGRLGVAFTQALIAGGYLTETENDFTATDYGADWFRQLGIDPVPATRSRRVFARKCLDWSERRFHLGGALGAAALTRFLELGWVARVPQGRILRVTHAGQAELRRILKISVR